MTTFLLAFIGGLMGGFIGFDMAFRVTAYRTREIVRMELKDRQQ